MKILKSVAIAAGFAIMTANVCAQEKAQMDPQQMAQKMTDRVKQNVTGVTPDQEGKILAANQEFAKSMQDAMASSNGDRDAARSKMQPAKEARDAKIKGILNAAQFTQFQKMEASHQMGGHKGGNQ